MKYAGMVLPLLLAGCASEKNDAPPPPNIGMANPAAVYCVQKGGTLQTVKTAAGESANCKLPNGEVIDEWALFRRDHPQS